MELEMTKLNGERDSEQLLDSKETLEQEKQLLEAKVAQKKTKV